MGGILGKIISKFFKWTGLSGLDRLLGAGFGFVRGLMMAAAFVTSLMAFTPTPQPSWMVGSQVLPYAVDASNVITAVAPRSVKDAFKNSLTEIRKVWDEQVKNAKSKLKTVDQ